MNPGASLSAGQLATLACMLEVTIPKPGNVHRGADFADTTLQDFLTSAVAIGPAMDRAGNCPLGITIWDAVRATRAVVDSNTNLGMVLLLAPLATVNCVDRASLTACIEASDARDCRLIYRAIAACRPGGLQCVDRHDVTSADSPHHILQAMRLAVDRDMIARQYVNGFQEVLEFVLPAIHHGLQQGMDLVNAVIVAHLKTMCEFPDSLIARKNGLPLARAAGARAGYVLEQGGWNDAGYLSALEDFDFWLRSDGNRRNPGTTADLITAGLFAGLRRVRFCGDGTWSGGPLEGWSIPVLRWLSLMSFSVTLEKEALIFSAAHFITFVDGAGQTICESLHGHNYRVAAQVDGALDRHACVIDFIWLRDTLQQITRRLDHHVLLPERHPDIHVHQDGGEWIARFEERRWVFPEQDVVVLPIDNTTAERLAEYIGGVLIRALQDRQLPMEQIQRVVVSVDENEGQWARWQTAPAG